ncbi:MAG: IPT/TIG domain-containing protein, partial [Solirubrobacteraceae bacterium]|nr:IPT/TIG domain-containing protein [Solirubrobacteraceae bacterium]
MSTTSFRRYLAPAATMVGLAFGATLASLPTPDDVAGSQPPRPPGSNIQVLTPANGPAAGGNTVTLTGERLALGERVLFGEAPATVERRSDTQVVVKAPPGLSGTTVQVRVENPFYYNYSTKPYTYDGHTRRSVSPSPERGTPAGGTEVALTGAGIDFAGTKAVTFGGRAASIVRSSATEVVVKTPPGDPKSRVQIAVQTADGNFEGSLTSAFTYNANSSPPVITSVTPSTAFTGYGSVTIQGIALEETT